MKKHLQGFVIGLAIAMAACAANPVSTAYNVGAGLAGVQASWLAVCPGDGSGTAKLCHDPDVVHAVQMASNAATIAFEAYQATVRELCKPPADCTKGINATTIEKFRVSTESTVAALAAYLGTKGITPK